MHLRGAVILLVAACRHAPPPPHLETERPVTLHQRHGAAALTPAERDSILAELAVHRAAWRRQNITDYQVVIAAGCFCPWPSQPAILEVRNGVAVALRDTLGKSLGALREPWSVYTVDGLFDAVEQAARHDDVVEVAYDPRYDYPAQIRGDSKIGLPDDWFWVRASRLTPAPPR